MKPNDFAEPVRPGQRLAPLAAWLRSVRRVEIDAAWERIKDGGGSGRDGLSPAQYARHLEIELRRLNSGLRRVEHRFMPYVEFLKSKGAGKYPRVISIPSVRDRVVLRVMSQYLKIMKPAQVSTRLPQDTVARVIAELGSAQWDYFAKYDVKDFYPTISHSFLEACLVRAVRNRRVVELFMSAVRTPTMHRSAPKSEVQATVGVPQGLAISNGLAEIALEHIDRFLGGLKGVVAFRFVDDILVLADHQDRLKEVERIHDLALLAGLEIHDKKSGPDKASSGHIDESFDFLGYKFEWPRVTVRKGSVVKLESRIAKSFTTFRYARARRDGDPAWEEICRRRLVWHLDLVISGFVLDGRRIGWMAYFSQVRNQTLLRHLDEMVKRKARKIGLAEVEFKSFVKTYRLVSTKRVDESGYVPNFDLMPPAEMRGILSAVFNQDVTRLSDDEVRGRFVRRVKRISRELESDVPSYR